MKVAFLGWGSLCWNPGTLRVLGEWKPDGPSLPIEFARISRDGRPTLVMYKAFPNGQKTEDIQVFWADAAETDQELARKNLACRENPELVGRENEPDFNARLERTAALVLAADPEQGDELVEKIKIWGKEKGFDAIVWTALKSNWDDAEHRPREPFRSLAPRPFSCENLKAYLQQLNKKQKDTALNDVTRDKFAHALEEAERYVRFAPAQIRTRCRAELESDPAFKWTRFLLTGITSAIDPTAKRNVRELWARFLSMFHKNQAMFHKNQAIFHKNQKRDEVVQPMETIAQDFAAEFRKASELLGFLMSEGYPYHVPDQIIDEIETSRELLKDSSTPSKEDRAKLLKAYRDLVTIPQTSVTFDRMPPTPFWSTHTPWLWSILLFGVVPSIVALIALVFIKPRYWFVPIIYLTLLAFIFWGLYVFTGLVTNRKLNQIITFCYIFTGIALTASILPFCIPHLFSKPSFDAPLGVLRGCALKPGDVTATAPPEEVLCDTDKNSQWVINIGGVPGEQTVSGAGAATQQDVRYTIRGGVVVPLYVIVLALFGSAVSMTRRVPEYQRRAMDSQDPLTNVQARENLVFQIMQVLSAPLIAITVYYIIRPNTAMTSVVLGFGSGFASEPILLMIRSLVEKLSPTTAAEPSPSPVTVSVTPASVTLQPNQTQQFSAKVSGSQNSQVTWLIDPSDASAGTISQSGYYVSPGSALAKTVTITASSAADRTKSGSASVTVKP